MQSSSSMAGYVDFAYSAFSPLIVTSILAAFVVAALITKTCTQNRHPPGPPSLPIIGHLHLLSSKLPQSLLTLSQEYGPIMQLHIGAPIIVVSDATIAKEILKTQDVEFASKFVLGFGFTRFNIYDGDSFLSAEYGPYWRFLRKLCRTQLFAGPQLDRFLHIREQETMKFLKAMVNRARNKEPCDLATELTTLTASVICWMLIGKRCTENPGLPMQIRKLQQGIMGYAGRLSFTQVFGPLKRFDLSGNGKKLIAVTMQYDKLMDQLIQVYEEKGTEKEGKDVMDILLETFKDSSAELELTKKQIKYFFLEMLFAGVDTTSAAIQWAMAELINNPKVMKKLRAEIDSVVGSNRLVKESDVPNLRYLDAIVKETLRRHPPGPLLRRQCNKDTRLNGYNIKAGTRFLINTYTIMRDPKTWNEPDKFIPERFLVDDGGQEMDYSGQDFRFLPFGSGRRSCIGASHSRIVVHTTIASLVQCFDFKLQDGDEADIKYTDGYSGAVALPLACYPVTRFDPFKA